MPSSIYAIATFDTKGQELAFVAEAVRKAGGVVTSADGGTAATPAVHADIAGETVAAGHSRGARAC